MVFTILLMDMIHVKISNIFKHQIKYIDKNCKSQTVHFSQVGHACNDPRIHPNPLRKVDRQGLDRTHPLRRSLLKSSLLGPFATLDEVPTRPYKDLSCRSNSLDAMADTHVSAGSACAKQRMHECFAPSLSR